MLYTINNMWSAFWIICPYSTYTDINNLNIGLNHFEYISKQTVGILGNNIAAIVPVNPTEK